MTDHSRALVVYDSHRGRTASLAEAVAGVLVDDEDGTVDCMPLRTARRDAIEHTALLVVGVRTRAAPQDPDVVQLTTPRLISAAAASWLQQLPEGFGRAAAVFDTRPERRGPGAAGVVAEALLAAGYDLVCPPTAFVVDGSAGPLSHEEWLRARRWAASRLPAGSAAAWA